MNDRTSVKTGPERIKASPRKLSLQQLVANGCLGRIWPQGDLAHGDDEDGVDLDEIEKCLLQEAQYNCSGCVIHFSGCSVLSAPTRVKALGTTKISGVNLLLALWSA
ncbi:MAG: hypothetical protein F4186_11475, partial [Boseongicola sp. SB0676_bin_33]|nr:hypothetical protein [Boseongicola sp. SB0676_bin_33]